MIEGVATKELVIHKDERGFFCELIRASDDFFGKFAQLSHSMANKGVLKAWHLHKKQTDWMYVTVGDIKLALYDTRENSRSHGELMEILLGETFGRKVVKIPPGVAHGYKVLSAPMHIIYLMDQEYDPNDELRIPSDDPKIGYDWEAPLPTK